MIKVNVAVRAANEVWMLPDFEIPHEWDATPADESYKQLVNALARLNTGLGDKLRSEILSNMNYDWAKNSILFSSHHGDLRVTPLIDAAGAPLSTLVFSGLAKKVSSYDRAVKLLDITGDQVWTNNAMLVGCVAE